MLDHIYVKLDSSKAAVSVNYSGGCYIEFWPHEGQNSIAFPIYPEDLMPLIEALRVADRRTGIKREDET